MSSTDANSDRDTKAIEALIAATLHQDESLVEPSVVSKYMKGDFILTPEEERALVKPRPDFLATRGQKTSGPVTTSDAQAEALVALHRNKPKDGFSAQTEEELARKRRELRERLRQKNKEP